MKRIVSYERVTFVGADKTIRRNRTDKVNTYYAEELG